MKHPHRFPAQTKFTEELRRTDRSSHPPGGDEEGEDGGLRGADAGRPRASLRSEPAFAGRARAQGEVRRPRPGRLPRRTCGSAPPPASPGSGAAAAPAETPPSQKAASSALPWRRDGSCPRAIRGRFSFPRLPAPHRALRGSQGGVSARVFKQLSRERRDLARLPPEAVSVRGDLTIRDLTPPSAPPRCWDAWGGACRSPNRKRCLYGRRGRGRKWCCGGARP